MITFYWGSTGFSQTLETTDGADIQDCFLFFPLCALRRLTIPASLQSYEMVDLNCFPVLGIEPKALYMLGKHSAMSWFGF